MELWVPQPLSVRPGQSSCGLLAVPQEDLPKCLSGARHPIVSSLAAIAVLQLL